MHYNIYICYMRLIFFIRTFHMCDNSRYFLCVLYLGVFCKAMPTCSWWYSFFKASNHLSSLGIDIRRSHWRPKPGMMGIGWV